MALLKITDEDILRQTPPTEGWFLLEIMDCKEEIKPKKAEGKEYDTYTYSLKVIKQSPDVAEDNIGRWGMVTFYTTAMGFMIPFVESCLETKLTASIEFDPHKLVGKQIMGQNVKGVYKDKPNYKWETWAPASGCPF